MRGQLVHDDIGPRRDHGGDHGVAVERVDDDRLGALRAQRVRLGGERVMPVTSWPAATSCGTRAVAERTGGACEEDLHDVSFRRHGAL